MIVAKIKIQNNDVDENKRNVVVGSGRYSDSWRFCAVFIATKMQP